MDMTNRNLPNPLQLPDASDLRDLQNLLIHSYVTELTVFSGILQGPKI